jgi:hypothetical protein
VGIDGSSSRGTGLSYFIEFGDGSVATASQAARVVDVNDRGVFSVTARLTVVDRFGRSDSRSQVYPFFQMGIGPGGVWAGDPAPDGWLALKFYERSGTTYRGSLGRNPTLLGFGGDMSAVLSGKGDIRITMAGSGIEFRGTVTLGASRKETHLTLVQHGGPEHGRTWRVLYRDGP